MQTRIILTIVLLTAFSGTLCAQEKNSTPEKPPFNLEVLVLDEHDKPVSGATVGINFVNSNLNRVIPNYVRPEQVWKTNEDGLVRACVEDKYYERQPNTLYYVLFARSPDGRSMQFALMPWAGRSGRVSLRFPPPFKLSGQIIDVESGKPIPNVPVCLSAMNMQFQDTERVTTDEQGYFLLDNARPGARHTLHLQKNISEEEPGCWVNVASFSAFNKTDIDVIKVPANAWTPNAADRFLEGFILETEIPNLEKRFEEMFKRAKKNGRNVVFYPYSDGRIRESYKRLSLGTRFTHYGPHFTWMSPDAGTIPAGEMDYLQPFELVRLHTPKGIGRGSLPFQILKKMTGQEVQSDVYMIAFSADGKFLGLASREDVYEQYTYEDDWGDEIIGSRFSAEKLREFLEKHAPK